jgi:hypothetical protein
MEDLPITEFDQSMTMHEFDLAMMRSLYAALSTILGICNEAQGIGPNRHSGLTGDEAIEKIADICVVNLGG